MKSHEEQEVVVYALSLCTSHLKHFLPVASRCERGVHGFVEAGHLQVRLREGSGLDHLRVH